MSKGGGSRAARVGERIRAEIMELVMRGELRDPRASGVIVSAVDVTADLSVARVWLRSLDPQADAAAQKRMVAAMTGAGGFLRREVGGRLGLRQAPELRFAWDASADRAARVEEVLAEVAAERTAKDEEKKP